MAQTKKQDKWVEIKSPNTKQTYTIPEEMKGLSVSAIIRSLTSQGMSRAEIAKRTGIRYQHVRNVLNTPLKRG